MVPHFQTTLMVSPLIFHPDVQVAWLGRVRSVPNLRREATLQGTECLSKPYNHFNPSWTPNPVYFHHDIVSGQGTTTTHNTF